MLAVSWSDGRIPVVSDTVNIAFSTGEISSAHILSKHSQESIKYSKRHNKHNLSAWSSSVKESINLSDDCIPIKYTFALWDPYYNSDI